MITPQQPPYSLELLLYYVYLGIYFISRHIRKRLRVSAMDSNIIWSYIFCIFHYHELRNNTFTSIRVYFLSGMHLIIKTYHTTRSNLRVKEIISSIGYWNGRYANDYLGIILLAGLETSVRCTQIKTYFCMKSIDSLQWFLLYLIHRVIDVQREYELHIINNKG